MSILTQSLSAILANYADVIEGGNSYRGSGTAYTGIPGTQSHLHVVKEIDGFAASSGSTTTAVAPSSIGTWVNEDFVKTASPPLFLLATAGTARNVGAARKVSAYAPSTRTFTVAAFPEAVAAADTLAVREGFKRAPDDWDLNDDDVAASVAFDRFFQLAALPGRRLAWSGAAREVYETTLELRLRLMKHDRSRKAKDSALENVLFMRSALTRGAHRDGTYTQVLHALDTDPEVLVDDKTKVIVADRYRLTYAVSSSFL